MYINIDWPCWRMNSCQSFGISWLARQLSASTVCGYQGSMQLHTVSESSYCASQDTSLKLFWSILSSIFISFSNVAKIFLIAFSTNTEPSQSSHSSSSSRCSSSVPPRNRLTASRRFVMYAYQLRSVAGSGLRSTNNDFAFSKPYGGSGSALLVG